MHSSWIERIWKFRRQGQSAVPRFFAPRPKRMLQAPVLITFAAVWASVASQSAPGNDPLHYCAAVQNRVGFIRYPLGALGAWSTDAGEMADVMTRVPRIYPCLNTVVMRGAKDDWRATIGGDPSVLNLKYRADRPCGAAEASITVSPHVSVFRFTFPKVEGNKYLVFDFGKGRVDDWARLNRWTNRIVRVVGPDTIEASAGEEGGSNAFYVIRISAHCVGSGVIDSTGAIQDGATGALGERAAAYAQFAAASVTVAIAESFTSIERAREFLAAEYADFETVHKRCEQAWKQVLGRVELEGDETTKRMGYTALYTMYANLINGEDGSCYLKYYPHPRSLASSAYWQFIGGFQSCCWDNYRTPYPFLMLSYPEVMSDILGTYLARYQRDGCVDGNICLFTGPAGGHRNIRFSPVLVAEAYHSGIEADYPKLYAALKDNFGNESLLPPDFLRLGYATQPPAGGKACSETLELATGLHSLAVLAKANDDLEAAQKYSRLSRCYTNVWDAEHQVFRMKNADGSWGVMNYTNWTWNPNPQGLFEGSTKDWMFSVPHDPYGLISLPGQTRFVERVRDYCLNDTWFNDYQYHYPYLLYYAGAPSEADKILRNSWVPMFQDAVMYEGVKPQPPHHGWQTHYTGNSGWLLCSMLGLYPVPTPPGQFIISSPSFTKATIRARGKEIEVQAKNNSAQNTYVRGIKVDDAVYPCYMIPARRLAGGARIDLEMCSDPTVGLGDLYIGSSDGFILSAGLEGKDRLKFVVEAGATEATTKIFSRTKPARVLVNSQPDSSCDYDEASRTTTITTAGKASIEVSLK
jgi:predicted alpha-1,2-mannosidase